MVTAVASPPALHALATKAWLTARPMPLLER
jgi:hypothetical protein